MARYSIVFGLLLIALGLVGYLSPTTFGEVGEKGVSPTALIPAGIGMLLIICGAVVLTAPYLRKHVMHVAALFGLIGAAGGFMPLMRSQMDFSKSSAVAGLLMILLCATFVVMCVRSFVLARIARRGGLGEVPRGA